MKRITVLAAVIFAAFFAAKVNAVDEELNRYLEIRIQVQPRIIEMTKGAQEAPLSAARIRSGELRKALKNYKVSRIARVIETSEEWINGELVEVQKEVDDTFMLKIEKYADAEGRHVSVDLDEAVSAFGALSVVISAERM